MALRRNLLRNKIVNYQDEKKEDFILFFQQNVYSEMI